MKQKKIYVRRNEYFNDTIEIQLAERDLASGQLSYMREIVFEELAPHMITPQSPLVLEIEEAQRLMDELWNCGLRPSEGSGSAGAMAAAQNHIKDLQSALDRSFRMAEKLIEK